jgi:hypothetical protein
VGLLSSSSKRPPPLFSVPAAHACASTRRAHFPVALKPTSSGIPAPDSAPDHGPFLWQIQHSIHIYRTRARRVQQQNPRPLCSPVVLLSCSIILPLSSLFSHSPFRPPVSPCIPTTRRAWCPHLSPPLPPDSAHPVARVHSVSRPSASCFCVPPALAVPAERRLRGFGPPRGERVVRYRSGLMLHSPVPAARRRSS